MSDPVSNADIEDVLSSIRRLVSEEPAEQKTRPEPPKGDVERFVLTPAFRVPDPEEDSAEEPIKADVDLAAVAPKPEAPAGERTAFEPVDDTVTDLAPKISAAFESDGEWRAPLPPETEKAAGDVPPVVSSPIAEAVVEQAESPRGLSFEERVAGLEAAIEQAPQEWEPDGSEDGDSDETRPLSFDTGGDGSDLEEVIAPTAERSAADETFPELDAEFEDSDPLDEPAAQTKALDAESDADSFDIPSEFSEPAYDDVLEPDEWEDFQDASDANAAPVAPSPQPPGMADELQNLNVAPVPELDGDAIPDDEVAEVHMPAEDPAAEVVEATAAVEPIPDADAPSEIEDAPEEPVTQAAAEAEADPSDDEPVGNILADDEAMLDEEALREMVSDIVREELQGVLGERITRNVRRLVRREIQRAMTMRDLD